MPVLSNMDVYTKYAVSAERYGNIAQCIIVRFGTQLTSGTTHESRQYLQVRQAGEVKQVTCQICQVIVA